MGDMIIEKANKNIHVLDTIHSRMSCPTKQFRARDLQYHAPAQERHVPLRKVKGRVHAA